MRSGPPDGGLALRCGATASATETDRDTAQLELLERVPRARAEATRRVAPHVAVIRVIAFVVGAASLGAEIAAARLLAPYFGASTIIWANTIATVLVALSVGYAIGGRLADRRADLRGLCSIVLTAAARPLA